MADKPLQVNKEQTEQFSQRETFKQILKQGESKTSKMMSANIGDLVKQNQKIGQYMEKNNILLTGLNKLVAKQIDITQDADRERKASIKSTAKKKDPMAETNEELTDIKKLMEEQYNLQKKQQKEKKGAGILGWIGALAGLGGLLGFLFTGKVGFLSALVKGLLKYGGAKMLGKVLFGSILKLPFVKPLAKVFTKAIGGLVKPIAKPLGKILGKAFGVVGKSFGKLLAPLAKGIGGIFGKAGIKAGAKGGVKSVGKGFLKKIPVVGALIGLIFGIGRFKKGDWLGGLLEVASGISSIVPGVGTALGIAIDSFLIFRDLKGTEAVDKGMAGGIVKAGKWGLDTLKKLPGVGMILSIIGGIKKVASGDVMGGLEEIGGALSNLPGVELISKVIGFVKNFVKSPKETVEKAKKVITAIPTKLSQVPAKAKELYDVAKGKAVGVKDVAKGVAGSALALPETIKQTYANVTGSAMEFGSNVVGDFMAGYKAPLGTSVKDIPPRGRDASDDSEERDEGKEGQGGLGWRLFRPWKPKIKGLQSRVWNKFQAMAKEFYDTTGKSVQINSAYRGNNKGSMHSGGLAIDINSSDADKLDRSGLLQKYGFHRPLLNWWKQKEAWHIEPYPGKGYGERNTINMPMRQEMLANPSAIGGDNLNMPKNDVVPDVNGSSVVSLSPETINSIVNGIAKANGKLAPAKNPTNVTTPVFTDARG